MSAITDVSSKEHAKCVGTTHSVAFPSARGATGAARPAPQLSTALSASAAALKDPALAASPADRIAKLRAGHHGKDLSDLLIRILLDRLSNAIEHARSPVDRRVAERLLSLLERQIQGRQPPSPSTDSSSTGSPPEAPSTPSQVPSPSSSAASSSPGAQPGDLDVEPDFGLLLKLLLAILGALDSKDPATKALAREAANRLCRLTMQPGALSGGGADDLQSLLSGAASGGSGADSSGASGAGGTGAAGRGPAKRAAAYGPASEATSGVTARAPAGGALSALHNQQQLDNALRRAGATDDERKLALAIQLTENADCISRDASKDGRTDGSRNFGPLNMNEDMLRRHWKGDPVSLNQAETLAARGQYSAQAWTPVAQAFLACLRAPDEANGQFLHHHRDGYGLNVPNTTAAYVAGLQAQMGALDLGLGNRANVDVAHLP